MDSFLSGIDVLTYIRSTQTCVFIFFLFEFFHQKITRSVSFVCLSGILTFAAFEDIRIFFH